jgi:hypothetical protein
LPNAAPSDSNTAIANSWSWEDCFLSLLFGSITSALEWYSMRGWHKLRLRARCLRLVHGIAAMSGLFWIVCLSLVQSECETASDLQQMVYARLYSLQFSPHPKALGLLTGHVCPSSAQPRAVPHSMHSLASVLLGRCQPGGLAATSASLA